MTLDEDEILQITPLANGAGVFVCPDCGRPHIVLFDANDIPIAQYIVPEDGEFFGALKTAMERRNN